MKRLLCLLMAFASLLIAGCSAFRTPEAGGEYWFKEGVARPAGDSESLLMYFEYVRKLPAAELTKEHETVRQLFAKSNSDFLRVRYAMLLSAPGVPAGDEARALELLDPVLRNVDGRLHTVAFMLSAQIQEQRRGQGLQQKLEALKSLEKNLIEREPAGAFKRR